MDKQKFSDIQGAILELVKKNEQEPKNIYYIIVSFVQGCLLKSTPISGIQDTILGLAKQNPNNIVNIVGGFVQGCSCFFVDKLNIFLQKP